MRDAEQPAPELLVVAQAADVPDGGDKRLLHQVQAGLFLADEFKNKHIQRQLIAPEERVPSRRFPGAGLGHGQLFGCGHFRHFQSEECARRAKVQCIGGFLAK